MFHRTFTGLIVALVASSVLSPAAAQPAAVEVILVGVAPGTPSGDGDWCVGDEQVTVTARVVEAASQIVVTEGKIMWEFCASPKPRRLPQGGLRRARPPALESERSVTTFLPSNRHPSPSLRVCRSWAFASSTVPRRAAPSKGQRALSFNLDTTCAP